MAYMIALSFGILFIALVGDLYERHLKNIDDVNKERMMTVEEDDDMDYVELNGELIPYNEEDQE